MNLITCKKFKGGDSLELGVLSGGRVSSRAVGGASSSGRIGSSFSFILLIAFLFGASSAWAADWTDKDDPNVTYTALKYIKGKATAQTTGGGWFVLPIKPNGTDIVKMRFKLATTEWTQFLWCNRAGSSLAKYPKFGAYFSVAGYVQCQRNTGNTAGNTNPGTGECSIEVNYNTLKFYVNGTEQSNSLVTGEFDPLAANTMLFASNIQTSKSNTTNYQITDNIPASNVSNRGSYYLYDFQIYDSATNLTHNIVPAMRDTDSVTGLYDTATGTFYTKAANSGEFDAEEWGADRAGKKWTGLGGDNKMSTGANWEGGVAPQAGDDIDFTIAVPFAAIEADIDATFGKIYLGTGDLPAFSGELSATGINDLERMTAYDTAADGFAFTLAAPSGQDLIWNGGAAANWNATDKSWLCNVADSVWYDHNNAIFNTAGATATLTINAAPDEIEFRQSATIVGSSTLTVPTVSVVPDVTATISAPTAGELTKTGVGTLTLGFSRTDQTTLSEGTLVMASGATLDLAKLTLGTDPAKPVSLNLGGATINADLTSCMSATVGGAAGGSVAIDNGAITNTANLRVWNGWLTLGSDTHVTMNASTERWVCVGGKNSNDENVKDKDAYLVLDGASIKERGEATLLGIGDYGTYPSKGTMIVKNGGSYTTDNSVYVAHGCEGHLVIDGEGSSVTAYQLVFCGKTRCADDENGYVVVTNGGTLVVDRLGYGSGNGEGYFRFDGGTLRAKTTNETLLPAHEKLHYIVGAEGGTIDNDGKNITIAKSFSGPGMIDLTGSGKTTFAAGVGVDAEGGVYVDTGTTLTINGATQSCLGTLILKNGSTLDIATAASDVAAFEATELQIPANDGAVTLTSGGGAFVEGRYAICKMSGVTPEAGAKFAPLTSTDDLKVGWSVDEDDTLVLTVGDVSGNTWTGGANNGNLSDPKNWLGGAVPESGTATINTTGTLTVGDTFRPDVIVFPETCGAVTIKGENAITGLTAITNLSVSTCTFEVPVAFADKICVSQGAYYGFSNDNPVLKDGGKVRFAGGVTGASFADGTSRRLDGAFTIPATANWTANSSAELWTVTGNSSLTITDSSSDQPASTDLSWLNNNGAFTTAVIRTSARICVRNEGDYVVTEELAMTLPGADRHIAQRASHTGKYKFEKVTLGDNGTYGVFYFANSGAYYMDKHVYIGNGGLCFAEGAQPNTAYAFGRRDNDKIYIYPWHSDYAINGKGGSTRDLIIFRATTLYTDDESGVARTVTLNGVADVRAALTVKGRGRFQVNSDGINGENVSSRIGSVTVTDSATLSYASGADLGAGAVTVGANATMEVASGEHTFDGGLTLNDGATLAFNFTERTVTPQIAIAEGKTLTVNGAVKVKIPAQSKWPTGGEKVLTTCGGFDAEGVTVSLAEGAPRWVRGLSVVDGNIVLDVKPMGTRVIVR